VAEPLIPPTLGLKTQVVRFVITGGLAAVVDFGLYVAGLGLGLNVNVAKSLTFQAPPSKARFVAVMLLYALTYTVQVGINYIFYMRFAEHPWRVPVAFVIAQGTATVINFIVQRSVIFRLR
jgi:putative flippase GtrA